MKKKLAIISSYNESCGNASYTEVLKREFEKVYDVDVLPLQIDLLESNKSNVVKIADNHIKDIANKLRAYDYVNIQFEAGLYGSSRANIIRRVKMLIKASNNLIVTMHRIDVGESLFDKNVVKRILSGNILKNLKIFRQSTYMPKLYAEIIRYVKKYSTKRNMNIIVHTKRDKKVVQRIFGFNNVYDFPLTFLNSEQRKRKRIESEKESFLNKYNLSNNDVVIGLFGFISEYKGHETAIKSLKLLPPNYKVIVFGSQHPMSIQNYTAIDSYLNKLIELIEENSVSFKETVYKKIDNTDNLESSFDRRVIFAGNLDDDDFINALYCCDFAVLPYMEVNQSGSGIASLVLESKIKSLYSNSKAFL